MIVEMKKVTLLVSAKEKLDAVKKLRSLGVMHIKYINQPVSGDITELESKLNDVEKALLLLGESKNQKKIEPDQAQKLVSKILELDKKRENLNNQLAEKRDMYRWFQEWSRVSLASIQKLEDAGVYIRYYIAERHHFEKIPEDKNVHIVDQDKNIVKFVLITRDPDERLALPEARMPKVKVEELENEIAKLEEQNKQINKELSEYFKYTTSLETYRQSLTKQLELNRVLYSMGDEGSFTYLQGFIPHDQVVDIEKTSEKEGWGYIVDDPDDPREVPTLIRNKKPIRIIQPLYDFMGTLPGYNELDVSLVFLIFFSIFYAMLVGDGGYGLVFLIGTFLASRKFKNAPREPFFLFYVLSFSTILWGLITGTWFGSTALANLPFLEPFIIDKIYSFNESSEAVNFLMKLTFIIGGIQLAIARLMAAGRKFPSLPFIAEVGWVFILGCVYFVANNLVLGEPMPDFAITLLIIGSVLVAGFANFQKNVLKGFLITLGNLPLDIIGSFSDIVSYIRLFAVGVASVTVAYSFNDMAGGVLAPIILLLGHGLNILLCLMAVIVHGIRLNMLEFSQHLGQEWTGKKYQPFKE